VVPDGIKVWEGKRVPDNTRLTDNLQYGISAGILCDEDGICGRTNVSVTPELCCKIGAALASLSEGAIIAVASGDTLSARALKYSAMSGVLSTGSNLWDFGVNFESQFDFCMLKSMADYGVYISSDGAARIKIVAKGGLPLPRSQERKLEGAVNRSEYRRAESEKFGTAVDLSSLREMYAIELIKAAKENLSGIGVQIKTANAAVRRVLEDALVKLGCGLEGDFCLHISADGKQLSVYSDEFGYIRHDKLLVLLCGDYFETEKELAVPYGAPKVLDEIAAQHGAKLYRYEDCPCDQSDEYARRLAVDAPFVRDGLLMAIKLLSYLKEHAVSIAEAIASIPKFGTANRFVSVAVNPTTILRKLGDGRQKIGEGLSLKVDKGDVRIRPVKSGKGVLLFAESASSETAEEICDFFENIVSGQEES
jgi:mannose-1-phosphate guanylyltransferase / phosphomannomutase